MVHLNEATTDLMDQLMKVDIFHPLEKFRMLQNDDKTFLDPNLIMNERHRTLRENFQVSSVERSVLTEAKRLFMEEEARELYMKKQQRFFDRELKKFETEVRRSRPKFSKSYSCKKKNFASSDDENFWESFKKIKNKTNGEEKSEKKKRNTDSTKKSALTEITEDRNKKKMEYEIPCIGSIKVTIKDKPNIESQTRRLRLLRKYFDALKQNAEEEQRVRNIKIKIQQTMTSKLTRKYFDIWRTRTKCKKNIESENAETKEILEERKIELFINAITERQKELMKNRKLKNRDGKVIMKEETNGDCSRKKNIRCKQIIVDSPAQNRLNAQKRIIEKQRAKLDEQNRIIEELKLKQVQEEISRARKETMDIAKETLTHLGQRTRRTLIHLMQQSGYKDESLTIPRQPPEPPKFLLRMEARAEARRKRIKLAEETRRRKLEEQRRKEETVKMEEEQTKRRLQREALAKARRMRKEREEHRLREIERFQKLNIMADQFYNKCLLKHYVMEPLMELVELKKKNMKKAEDHYQKELLKKIFTAWKKEAETQCIIKIEIAETIYNKNLMVRMFQEWRHVVKEMKLKYQVATDFHEMKLSEKYFKLWQVKTLKLKAEEEENTKIACSHYENRLKIKYFDIWKKYITILADIKESEKRKEELRQLVQKVIPDFDPKQRGVALED